MSRKHIALAVQILSFLLGTFLAIAINYLTSDPAHSPWGFRALQRSALPLAVLAGLLIVGVMVWQHVAGERLSSLTRPAWVSDRSPFPGLEAFTEHDAAVFFGRDAEIRELLERLHPVVAAQASRIVTVVGPSGAGKSSLIQAGVVPQLHRRRGGWIVVPPALPGDSPLRSLARSLAATGTGWSADGVRARLAAGAAVLPRFMDELRAARGRPGCPVLMIIDQAEELVTLSGQDDRDAFLSLLVSAVREDLRLWVLLVMRSEFLTAFLGTEQAQLFRDPVGVGALGRPALLEVIEQPASRAGLVFDPPVLPQQMADEAGTGDALPLLAYTLQELYLAAGAARMVTGEAYRRLGGVAGVLARQADKVAAELDAGIGGDVVLATLLRFVRISDKEPTRRRVRRVALSDSERRVADAFISARLLTSSGDGDDAVLDVAHEALLRAWAPLRQAIEARAGQLRWHADLERWAADWDRSGRQDAYLLQGGRLEAAQQWAADGAQAIGLPMVAEFLMCSNQADEATMQRLSETIARQALDAVGHDPDYGLLLALTALEDCAPTELALRALTAALVASQVRVVLRGHGDDVNAVAWSPDGRRLATTSADQTARVWDADSGNQLAVLHGHDHYVLGLAWSPDGSRLATASADGTARIWDAGSGTSLLTLRGHGRWVWGVTWSPDSRRLATGSADGTARIWDAGSGGEQMALRGHGGRVRGVAWSPAAERLASASADGTVRIWATGTGTGLITLTGHAAEVRAVAWSPDGTRLATASNDATARIWDATNGAQLAVLRGHALELRAVAWSPDGERLATASTDQTARVWSADSGRELMVMHGHRKRVWSVAWSPDGKRLATGSRDRTARIWDLDAGNQLLTVLTGHDGRVRCVAWSPDGTRLATASDDRTARIWSPHSGNELTVLTGHDQGLRAVAWSPDGTRLATASNDGTARIWDPDRGAECAVLRGHHSWLDNLGWSPDGTRLATASDDRTARIWDAADGRQIAVLRGHRDELRAAAWSPDGMLLATASDDRTARIWDPARGCEVSALHGHADYVLALDWSPDGNRLATGSGDNTVRIWDAGNRRELAVLTGHADEVRAVAWSPDGTRLATASDDRTVRIWDPGTGAHIVIGAHAAAAESVSWSPDGGRVASASSDGTSRVWNATISIDQLIASARLRVTRELTTAERRNLMLHPASS